MAFGLGANYEIIDLGDLTAVGATDPVITGGMNLLFQVKASSIAVGGSVTVRLEGSLIGGTTDADYFNLSEDNVDPILTDNGSYGFSLNGCPTKFVRVKMVAKSGGGTPKLECLLGAA